MNKKKKKTKFVCKTIDEEEGYSIYWQQHITREGELQGIGSFSQRNKEENLERNKRYFKTSRGIEVKRKANKKYQQTEKAKENDRKKSMMYSKTERGKEVYKKYMHTEKGKATHRKANNKYNKTEKGRENQKSARNKSRYKRKNLGFHMISFECLNCHWHHVNSDDVVACPADIHNKCFHSLDGRFGIKADKLEGVLG